MSTLPKRVAVVGAGITGLAAAYELSKAGFEPVLIEAAGRCGGKVLSETRGGLVLEAGPDSFLTTKPQALELVRELGLAGELIGTDPDDQSVFLYLGGRLRRLPRGMGFGAPSSAFELLTTSILSVRGRLRACLEPFIPVRRGEEDETVGSFVRRRLGAEILEKIAGPVLGGIFGGDADSLSLSSTFPQLRAMELKGSLWRAGRAAKPGKRESGLTMFMTLKGGMARLTEALERRLPPARKAAEAVSLRRRGTQWLVQTKQGAVEAAAVIAALPAWRLAEALGESDLELSSTLKEIPFNSTATVSLAFEKKALPRPPRGFGFISAPSEGKAVTAATFTSSKFPGRVPEDTVLVRCFMAGGPPEADLEMTARRELSEIMGWDGVAPKVSAAFSWRQAHPQYTLGHPMRLRRIESCLKGHPGLFLAGSSYHGVGLSDCIASARRSAAAAGEYLLTRRQVQHVH